MKAWEFWADYDYWEEVRYQEEAREAAIRDIYGDPKDHVDWAAVHEYENYVPTQEDLDYAAWQKFIENWVNLARYLDPTDIPF